MTADRAEPARHRRPARPGWWPAPSPRGRGLVVFVLRRLAWLVPVLVAVIVVTFALMQAAPGSPWRLLDARGGEGGPQLSEEEVAHFRAKYGLDRPWWQQLGVYVGNAARLDLGQSYRHPGREVSGMLAAGLWPTAVLVGAAMAVILPVGVGLGVAAALRHRGALDYAVTGLATLAASVPNFVVGIVLILTLSVGLHNATDGDFALPAAGFGLDAHLVLPVITLSLMPLAFMARLARASTLEALAQDHVRTAHAKGLTRGLVLARHVVPNALVPVITTAGPLVTFLVGGTIVIETLFQIPGLGGTLIRAIEGRDYPVILGATIVFTVVVVIANLLVDLAYALLDPRVTPN